MSVYGVRGIASSWFRSYLSDRQQYVSLNGASSELCSIDRGVPQGSILGPLLFLIFINDFPNCSDFFKFTLFADDSTLTCKFNNASNDNISDILTTELININNWINSNKIKLNSDKSNFIMFSYRKNIEINQIQFGNSYIRKTDSTKFLGIVIDKNLTFKEHINNISSKVSKSIGILYKLNHSLPSDILKILYNSLILPYLSYGIESWYGAPRYMTNKIFILQKKAIRAVHGLPYSSHTNNHFKTDKILKLQDLYKLNLCSQLFFYLTSSQNNTVASRFQLHSDIHYHNTRHRNNLVLPHYHRSKSQLSFSFQSIKEWNNIPDEIKQSETGRLFKSKLKDHYCCLY